MKSLNGAESIPTDEEEYLDINMIYPRENGFGDFKRVLNNLILPLEQEIMKTRLREPNGIDLLEKTYNNEEDDEKQFLNDNRTITDENFSDTEINFFKNGDYKSKVESFLRKKRCKDELLDEIQERIELGLPNEFDICFKKDFSLKDYQINVIKWMLNLENNLSFGLKGGIISLVMGLGKTLISITYSLIKWNANNKPSLIVCPKNLIQNWANEIDKFFGSEQCPYLILCNENTNSTKYGGITHDEIMKYKIIIVSYHRVAYLAKAYDKYKDQIIKSKHTIKGCKHKEIKELESEDYTRGADLLFDFNWNSIICDESHSFASHRSSTALGMMTISADRKWCLTGTPVRNYSKDLFSQFRFLGFDDAETLREFTIGNFHKNNLKEFILFKSYEDCQVYLPKRDDVICKLELSEPEKEVYKRFLHEAQDSYADNLARGKKGLILNLILKLRIICISPFLLTKLKQNNAEKSEEGLISSNVTEDFIEQNEDIKSWLNDIRGTAGVFSTKIQKCFEIINSIPNNEKVVVYSMFKIINIVMIEAMQLLCPGIKYLFFNGDCKNTERYEILDKFKSDPSIKIIFISYKVGGEGINLVEANHIILLEGWWNYCVIDQAISRVHRIGQTSKVKTWRLIVKDSIEEKMEIICYKKEQGMKDFLRSEDKLKVPDEILKELLKD